MVCQFLLSSCTVHTLQTQYALRTPNHSNNKPRLCLSVLKACGLKVPTSISGLPNGDSICGGASQKGRPDNMEGQASCSLAYLSDSSLPRIKLLLGWQTCTSSSSLPTFCHKSYFTFWEQCTRFTGARPSGERCRHVLCERRARRKNLPSS